MKAIALARVSSGDQAGAEKTSLDTQLAEIDAWAEGKYEIVDRIRELLVEDPILEGIDNANRFRRGLSMLDRAVDSERDAAVDLELTALYRECAARNLGEVEVFGS